MRAVTANARSAFAGSVAAIALVLAPHRNALAQSPPPDSAAEAAELRAACGTDAAARGLGLLRGTVHDVDARPEGSVALTVGWRRTLAAPQGRSKAGDPTDAPALGAFSDSTGHWQVCGAPLQSPLFVRAVDDDGIDSQLVTLDAAHPVATVDLSLHVVTTDGNAVRAAKSSALVVFSVNDREGRALGNVTLDLVPENGTARRVLTDANGHAIVPAVEPGRWHVKTLAMGYQPGDLYVPLDAGRNTVPLVLDAAHTPMLATVRVIGDRKVLARHQDFEARRHRGEATLSITEDDIEKRNPVDSWQMLTNVPAMRVIQSGSAGLGVYAMSTREMPVMQRRLDGGGGGTTVPCWYRVMIDGMVLPDMMPDLSAVLPPPGDIHGIEVFAGLATIPPQYNSQIADGQGGTRNAICGLISVWTK